MFARSEFSKSILDYISKHFPGANTEEWEHERNESHNFHIHDKEVTYVLRVMDECLENQQPADIELMLESFNVAQVVRDIRDFPIIVTSSGCIFGSP